MKYLLSGATIHTAADTFQGEVLINGGKVLSISPKASIDADTVVIQLNGFDLFPGFVDVHVHLREPGFSYKETIESGTRAAARGGFTTVCAMPNLKPPPDCRENLEVQQELIRAQALVNVRPYGCITVGEAGAQLADLAGLAGEVAAFSDDGKGVQADGMMRTAMQQARGLGALIAAHCEDESLLRGGYIHDGDYAKAHGHKGICSESEWRQIERDLALAMETGCRYHVCHVSAKESVELIRKAKAEGVDVSCETAPHYLVFTDGQLQEDGRFKMNPPLRGPADREALLCGLLDGTVDMIATDHAPHTEEEKGRGLRESLMGVVGLETAFPVLYTQLVRTGRCSLAQLLTWLHENPRRRFSIGTRLEPGQPADLTVFDLNQSYIIDPEEFQSKGRASPFAGMQVFGRCKLTMVAGKIVWEE